MKAKVYVLNIEDMSVEEAENFLKDDKKFIEESKKQGNVYDLPGFENHFNNMIGVEPEWYHRPDCFIKIVES